MTQIFESDSPSHSGVRGWGGDESASNPYVGLRPFERTDSLLFFGRREQTIALLERLHAHRFLPVLGSSGCGKSSLVRAGLVPAVLGGFLVRDRDQWDVATLKPGTGPLNHLAAALLGRGSVRSPKLDLDDFLEQLREEPVRVSLSSFAPWFGSRRNLLLIVDQFEEVFAYRGEEDELELTPPSPAALLRVRQRDEADEFVGLLLELARCDLPIYVVLTMRSDFMGDCDVFAGLPEAMNQSQYLVPRLTRQQLRQAIEGPASSRGVTIAPRLLDRLLNDAGDRIDQLPVLQHALLRTWQYWSRADGTGPLEQADYEAIGSLPDALAKSAAEALTRVDDTLAARIFKCLTDADAKGRRVRRASTVGELIDVCNAPEGEILHTLAAFCADGRHFVVVGDDAIPRQRRVEIAHESLIRQWSQLRTWVDEERLARDRLRDFVQRSRHWTCGEGDLLRGPDLALALRWRRTTTPTAAWAHRHEAGRELATVFDYLEASRRRHVRDTWIRRLLIGGFVTILIVISLVVWRQKAVAEQATRRAVAEAARAERATDRAEAEAANALDSASAAQRAFEAAQGASEEASARREEAEKATELAKVETTRAERSALQARDALRFMKSTASTSNALGVALLREVEDTSSNRWAQLALDKVRSTVPPERTLRPREAPAFAAFRPGSEEILTVATNGTTTLMKLATGEESVLITGINATGPIACSRDRRWLAAARETTALVWTSDGAGPVLELNGHAGDITALALSDDGAQLATAAFDRTLRVWRTDGTTAPAIRRNLSRRIMSLSFTPDGSHIAWGTEDQKVFYGRADAEGAPSELARHDAPVQALAITPNGRELTSGDSAGVLRVWDIERAEPRPASNYRLGGVNALAYNTKGTAIAGAFASQAVRVWQTAQYFPQLTGHERPATSVDFNSDGSKVVSAALDGTVRVWSMSGPGRPHLIEGAGGAVAFNPDGSQLLTAGRSGTFGLRLYETRSSVARSFGARTGVMLSAAFSPDGATAASGSRDGAVRIWKVAGWGAPTLLGTHDGEVNAIAFSPDGRTLASGSSDNTVRLWSTNGSVPPTILQGHTGTVLAVAFSPNGKRIASSSEDGSIRVWHLDRSAPADVLRGHEGDVFAVSFSPTGDRLVSGSRDKTVRIWPLSRAVQPLTLRGHSDAVRAVSFTPDGQSVVSGSADEYVRMWSIRNPSDVLVLWHPDAIQAMALSPDGRQLAVASLNNTYLWTAFSDKPLFSKQQILDMLWAATPGCLSPEQRTQLLQESEQAARTGAQRCNREVVRRGGTPVSLTVDD